MNVNFNGMSIFGNGKIMIGNNFHSGPGCQIISLSTIMIQMMRFRMEISISIKMLRLVIMSGLETM